jgi:membrane-associated protease RseP (regulator of RpoE activity)
MGEGLAARRRRFPALNVALFAATVATTLVIPLVQGGVTGDRLLHEGVPFSAALIGILLCHEMGHYLLARAWNVDTTLPFFIPAPIGIGTFGAVIRIRSPMPTRRAVLDIGAAGPIAGLAVAVPLYLWGLAHSSVGPVEAPSPAPFGSPLAILLGELRGEHPMAAIWAMLRGEAPSTAAGSTLLHMGDSLVTWVMQGWVHGPLPAGQDVLLHPVATAAWFGLFVTTLNLMPIGQLDGGHVLYGLLGRRGAYFSSRLVSWGLFLCGLLISWNWLVWWLLTRVVGVRHPPALLEEPLTPGRRAVAILCLLLFAATFIPVPISV